MRLNLKFVIFVYLLLVLNSLTGILYAKQQSKPERKNNKRIVVRVSPGIVTVLPASKGYFNHLKIVGSSNFEAKSSGGINIYRMGNNLLITFQQGQYPADIAIRDRDTDNIYLLALMPQSIPPRSYEIVLNPEITKTKEKQPNKNKKERHVETKIINAFAPVYPLTRPEGFNEGYEEFLTNIISKAAMYQKIPNASIQDPWRELIIKYKFKPLNGLVLYSVKRWFISKFEMDLFQAKNEGTEQITLIEPYLWQRGTMAVSFIYNFFRKEDQPVKLNPGASVPVLIVKVKDSE